ncbi:membrane protein insertase YidC, partial [Caulobacter sp. 17J65-9]|uniref:membrane protein insertase YidC n=1 Tax=Caulobacter sp. 17J65-9 TaxID=2709382 RepID=UPI0013CC0FCA
AKAAAAAVQTAPAAGPTGRPAVTQFAARGQALASSPRVKIQTPHLAGSVSLEGGRIDDLFLTQYRETLDKSSPPVELFRPEGAEHAYFADFGWTPGNAASAVSDLPGGATQWQLASGDVLSPGKPITLTYANLTGLRFTRTISVDDNYMFTVTDSVVNESGRPLTLAPYGSVQRQGVPPVTGRQTMISHEGAVGVFGQKRFEKLKYKDWRKKGLFQAAEASNGGWVGITDKYWLAAVMPDQAHKMNGAFRVTPRGSVDVYEVNFVGQPVVVPAGGQVSSTSHLFAGAKRAEILSAYQKDLNIPRFDDAIDWGMFWFLTRPIFWLLEKFYGLAGNFGVAILILTVTVKAIMFPLANKAFESMSKMKKLQPKMEELKKKYGSDPQKQQQETMALYQREKINPLAGCLPIFIQIPVFFALYKVLSVTIEMRHAPFFGWIHDLSAPDPTTMWNLFGLIPWDPSTAPLVGGLLHTNLHIGVLAILYGLTMWLQQSMNPPATDPMQKQMMQFFPIVFTFIMAGFMAGLLVYWIWNNVLSIAQQYVIMRRFGTENPIDDLIAKLRGQPKPAQ